MADNGLVATTLSYADAVRLLKRTTGAETVASHLAGGALLIAVASGFGGALNLFDAKTEIMRLGRSLISGLPERTHNVRRSDRSERLRAAHCVIVVAGLFDGLDHLDLPFSLKDVGLTRADQTAFLNAGDPSAGWMANLVDAQIPIPGPAVSYDDLLRTLRRWYVERSSRLLEYIKGLSLWDHLDETRQRRAQRAIREELPDVALQLYEGEYVKLGGEIPEFAVWAWRMDQHASGVELRRISVGLSDLQSLLRRMTSGSPAHGIRAALAAAYRELLDRPVAGAEEQTTGLCVPSLEETYMDPRFMARSGTVNDNPADQDWWADVRVRSDLSTFLAVHLTSGNATTAPLVVLGQPGAGKSALTRVLAARLSAGDFMPVRVSLRDVPADADVQEQVEHAVRETTGDRIAWPDLVRSADGALPVVLLDGLDELLQAIGVSQSNYLQKIATFQHREAVQGRPVAVIVTTRTAVADRARLAEGSVVLRLEPFDDDQIRRWVSVWNAANADVFAQRELQPLTAETVTRYRDLASHPLLLLMLALYDADGNALQRSPTWAGVADETARHFNRAHLYEQLLSTFASREIRREHVDGISEEQLQQAVEEELLRLSVVAFAMFNRSRGWVTEPELNADLITARVSTASHSFDADFHALASAAQKTVARFFFVQRVTTQRSQHQLHTYEFLHATFGEFLVARLIVRLLHDLTNREAASTVRAGSDSVEHPLLYALLSFTPLCTRSSTVLLFLVDLLTESERHDVSVRDWVIRAFRAAHGRADVPLHDYRPLPVPASQRLTRFTINLVLLALVCSGTVDATELFPGRDDPASNVGRLAHAWQSVLPQDDWDSLLDTISANRFWSDDLRRDITLTLVVDERRLPIDAFWIHGFSRTSPIGSFGPGHGFNKWVTSARIERAHQLRCDQGDDMMRHALEPVLERMPNTVDAFAVHGYGDAESIAHSLQRALLASAMVESTDRLVYAYDRCTSAIRSRAWGPGHHADSFSTIALVVEMLRRDAPRLPVDRVCRWLRDIVHSRQFVDEHLPATLDCALAILPDGAADLERQDDVVRWLVQHVKTRFEAGALTLNGRDRVLLWVTLHEAGAGRLARTWLGETLPVQEDDWRDRLIARRIKNTSRNTDR